MFLDTDLLRTTRLAFHQRPRSPVVFLNEGCHVESDDGAIAYALAPMDDGKVYVLWLAEDECGYGVVQCAGIGRAFEPPAHDVGGFAGFEAADVVATEGACAAKCGEFKCLAGGECGWVATDALEQHAHAGFGEEVAAVVRGAAVNSEANAYACAEHGDDRGDS